MLAAARALLDSEARALARASARLDGRFERAVELVLACGGKVITSGIGKSGFVARKLAATLCATGTPAAYLHPAEAMHGDLGLVEPDGPLARGCDAMLDASVDGEGDPHNLVPAASALVAIGLGDALAAAVMHAREFSPEQFGVLHPGGQLGRNLRLRVADVMHAGDLVPW